MIVLERDRGVLWEARCSSSACTEAVSGWNLSQLTIVGP